MLVCFVVLLGVLSGCNEEQAEELLQASEIDGLFELVERKVVWFEWLKTYNPNKPLAVFFHGEGEESFSLSLDRTAYTQEVLTSSCGWRGNGLISNQQKTKYDLTSYWTDIAGYNVLIFHWEKFAEEESYTAILSKLLSTYRLRYRENGDYHSFGSVPLVKVFAALYLSEMNKAEVSSQEIRFVGNGTGAVLCEALATYISKLDGTNSYLPYRITLCDAPLSADALPFQTEIISLQEPSVLDFLTACNDVLAPKGVALEVVESQEIGTDVSYAYTYSNDRTQALESFKSNVAYLALSERYSVDESFSVCKTKKRIAMDWYMYSVLGSDDETVGNPTDESSVSYNRGNWGSNFRRPVLNDRVFSEGTNYIYTDYAVSAWTPTAYIRAFRGVSFYQKKAESVIGTDKNGRKQYLYSDYVLEKFSSENRQVSDRRDCTIFCGYVYYDRNQDGLMNEGIVSFRQGSKIVITLTYETTVGTRIVLSEKKVSSAQDGFFMIRFVDGEGDIRITSSEGYAEIQGFNVATREYSLYLRYEYEKGYTNYDAEAYSSYSYERAWGNGFSKNVVSFTLKQDSVHATYVYNCLITDME